MRKTILLSLLFLCGVAAADEIDELAQLLEGTFDTHAADPNLPAEDRLIDKRVRVSLPWLGEYVFYQQINHREELSVYRQRILVLSQSEEGSLRQVAYALKDAAAHVDADEKALASLAEEDINRFMTDGCEQVFVPVNDGFHGRVDPAKCIITSSRTGKLRGIGAESIVTSTTLKLAERGFDAETGEQLFGTVPGDYIKLARLR